MTIDSKKLRDVKIKRRYGKKKISIDESYKKTMHQRKRMKKKKIGDDLIQKKLGD